MSRRAILLLAALLAAGPLAAAPVPAAPKADDSVGASAAKLLVHRKVQKELKLTAEQRLALLDALADLEEDYEKKLNDLARMENAPDDAYDKLDKERQKASDKLLADTAKALPAAQRARLRQLDWRLRGATAFADPQVEKLLQLTDAQKKTAADVATRMKAEVDRYLDGLGADDDAKRKAELLDFRKARLKEMEGALTADQKAAWGKLLGDPVAGFAVDELWLKIEEEADAALPPGGGK